QFCRDKAPHLPKSGTDSNSTDASDYYYYNSALAGKTATEAEAYVNDVKESCACYYPTEFYQGWKRKVQDSITAGHINSSVIDLSGDTSTMPDCMYPACANSWVAGNASNAIKGPNNTRNRCPTNNTSICIQEQNISVGGKMTGDISLTSRCQSQFGISGGGGSNPPSGGGPNAGGSDQNAGGSDPNAGSSPAQSDGMGIFKYVIGGVGVAVGILILVLIGVFRSS
ncbi:MAG: hypothetical protein VXX23_05595, partial [Actinomycetota bacterium]|nr:hypothetical protein [Actinomycetota bacterium]